MMGHRHRPRGREGRIPRLVRQQRWPLFWDAASLAPSSPVLEWIMASASRISRPIEFHEGQVAPQEAARIGWLALREVMRSWCIVSREGLTQWLRRKGFQAVQPGNHIGARAQEVLLGRACSEDARVALLESVYVALVLHTGREIRVEPALAATEAPRDSVLGGWAHLDEIDLQEELFNQVQMLKSCPHFLRGRMRECFAVASRENHRAKLAGDVRLFCAPVISYVSVF